MTKFQLETVQKEIKDFIDVHTKKEEEVRFANGNRSLKFPE